MIRLVLVAALLAVIGKPAYADGSTSAPAEVTGTVTYRQRMALPPNATLHVRLEDASRQDAAAPSVAEISMTLGTAQVPLAFAIPYAPSAIEAKHRYVVRATIASEGTALFTTDAAPPVLTNGAPAHVDIVLVLIAGGTSSTAAAPQATPATTAAPISATLEGTHWKLVELAGAAAAAVPGVPEAFLEFDAAAKRVAAIGGCNRLMGSYTLHGTALSIAAGGMTMMACPEPLAKQELAYTDALRATKSYRVANGALELLDGDKVLARFVAAPKS